MSQRMLWESQDPKTFRLAMSSATDIRNAAMEGNLEVFLFFPYLQLIQKLLAEGADVNARMNTGENKND